MQRVPAPNQGYPSSYSSCYHPCYRLHIALQQKEQTAVLDGLIAQQILSTPLTKQNYLEQEPRRWIQ